jgi:hypothetical protein
LGERREARAKKQEARDNNFLHGDIFLFPFRGLGGGCLFNYSVRHLLSNKEKYLTLPA